MTSAPFPRVASESAPRQRESDNVIAGLRAEFAMTSGGDDDVLPPVFTEPVSHRRRLRARGQFAFPQFPARLHVKSPQVLIHRRADKGQIAPGRHRAAEVD